MAEACSTALPCPSGEDALVAFRVADFLVRTEVERLALFNAHLRATVSLVSPMLLQLAVMEGLSLTEAFALLLPPEDWPWRPYREHPRDLSYFPQHREGRKGVSGRRDALRFHRAFAKPGLVIRELGHSRGAFAIRPCGRVLGFAATVGTGLLSSFGKTAMLKLPHPWPETLLAALPGRPLARLVDHPVFAPGDYRIVEVRSDHRDGLPIICFRTPLVAFRLQSSEPG